MRRIDEAIDATRRRPEPTQQVGQSREEVGALFTGFDLVPPGLVFLPNRALFTQRLTAAFAEPVGQYRVGLCLLDLDGFKGVNDGLGHHIGDQLLVAVAARLSACCGAPRVVARMSGDEFVILTREPASCS